MVAPYRDGGPPKALNCPRCGMSLPPLDVAACAKGCGTWVSQFASTEVLTFVDRKPDPVTRWWRVRVPCPVCGDQMKLHGEKPGLLQGCEIHGYFIDADTVNATGLAGGVDQAKLERKRSDTARVEAERAALETAREEEEASKMAIARREAELREGSKKAQALADKHAERRQQLAPYTLERVLIDYILKLEDRLDDLDMRLAALEKTPKS